MSDRTTRLALPMIVPGQAQKEMTHNEALATLDTAVQTAVRAIGIDTPPPTPTVGECWIVGDAPTGAWSGRADALATWTVGGWRFVTPFEGFRAWVADDMVDARFVDGGWVSGEVRAGRLIVGGRRMLATPGAAIAVPSGGPTVDTEARATIATILAALRHHNLVETG